MIPVVFDGCFGWFHRGHGTRGVVLCAAFGHENMIAHRGWRQLAEDLASEGFHVVRYDYPSTGATEGSEDDPDLLERWQDSVVAAVGLLQSISQTREVILIGLRLGATLALRASSGLDQVKGIACLYPVLSGRTYIRELRLRASGWREANLVTSRRDSSLDLHVLGDRLTPATVNCLMKIDFRNLSPRSKHVLFMSPGSGSGSTSTMVIDHLRSQDCNMTLQDFPDGEEFLEDSISSKIPYESFKMLVSWCDHLLPVRSCGSVADTSRGSFSALDPPVLHLDGISEQAVSFGLSCRLFGILCSPASGIVATTRPVIMLNTGFGRHTGDGRMFTTLARRLASAGIPSLRMDLANFGDSHMIRDSDPNPYADGTASDVKAAVDFLERSGYREPALVGVCSGAFTAFHATVREPRIRGLFMVNIQTFIWKTGLSLKVQNRRQGRPLSFYLRAATRPDSWRRARHGQVALGSIVMTLCQRPLMAMRHRLLILLERLTGWETSAGQVLRWFRDLDARGVRVSLLYSQGDPGLAELALQLGRNAARLSRSGNIQCGVLGDADHALLDHDAKSRFMEMVLDFVNRPRVPDAGSGAGVHSPVPRFDPAVPAQSDEHGRASHPAG